MKVYSRVLIVMLVMGFAFACTSKKSVMTIEDFSKIDTEIALPDPGINPTKVNEVAKKYGYSGDQYREFFQKVQNDTKLQEKLGEIRLKKEKK